MSRPTLLSVKAAYIITGTISAVVRLHTHSADLISPWLLQLVTKYFNFVNALNPQLDVIFVNAATSFL